MPKIDNVREPAKFYSCPTMKVGYDLVKRTSIVALSIFACTAFVSGLGLLLLACTSTAVTTFLSQCLVAEAVIPTAGSCLIFGFVIAVVEKVFDEFKKDSIEQVGAKASARQAESTNEVI